MMHLLEASSYSVTMWLVVILTTLVVLAVLSMYKRSFSYWKDRGVPHPAPQLVLGNTRKLFFSLSYAEYFKIIYDQFPGEPVCGVYQFHSPVLVIRDPSIIQKVLIKDFLFFQDRRLSFNEKKEPLSAHLLNMRGSKWRSLRSKLTPTFTSKKMRMMFPLMMECAEELRKFIEQSAEIDDEMEFKEIMARFTTDVIGTCAFGLKCNSMQNPNAEFRIMGKEVAQPSVNNLVRRIVVQALPFLKVRVLPPEVTKFFLTTVSNTMIYREKNGVIRNDFLQLLIELRKQGKVQNDDDDETEETKQVNGPLKAAGMVNVEFSDSMIAAQAFIFFLAGFETSSSTLSFCLHELAMNPDIQHKLIKEIDCELEKVEGNITYESILNMNYLSKVVDETLRKYPPAANISRIVTKQCPVPGHKEGTKLLDVGVRVIIPVHALHHDPVYYPDPERFDPERFSDEAKSARPGFTYLPFGDGPRNCIGKKFGLLQVKLGLVVLLSNFQFSIGEKSQVPLQLDPKSFISTAKGGIWLRVTKRAW